MKTNHYYEHKKWVFFWGLFLDEREEVQGAFNAFNNEGWYVIDFEWGVFIKLGFLRVFFISLISLLTLGFVSYWSGFTIIFEKDDTLINNPENKMQLNENKGSSILEYYKQKK